MMQLYTPSASLLNWTPGDTECGRNTVSTLEAVYNTDTEFVLVGANRLLASVTEAMMLTLKYT